MKFRDWRFLSLLAALTLWMQPASALDYFASGDELLASMVSQKTLSMLSDSQVKTLQKALTLLAIPATPDEFGRMLTIASQYARTDPQAQTSLQSLSAENAKWMDLSRGMPPPVELQTFLSLRSWQGTLPVYSKLSELSGKPTAFVELTKTTDTWIRSPFGVQAFRVRQGYVDLLAQEKPKADKDVAGARDVMTALLAPGSAAALQQLDKPSSTASGKPSCDDVLWLPALASEAGARRAKDGWERPEVPCR